MSLFPFDFGRITYYGQRVMKKDLYGILGVGRESNLKEIKRAYRAAAKRFHPDISPEDEEKFRELQGAYETLSDPAKRDEYDRELKRGRSWAIFGQHGMPHMDRPDTLYERGESLFSLFGPFWNGSRIEPSREPRDTRLEVILSPGEARRGGLLSLDIPLIAFCTRCGGAGEVRGLICGRCRGKGREEVTNTVSLTIPPRVYDGMERRVHFESSDVGEIDFVVTIRVRGSRDEE